MPEEVLFERESPTTRADVAALLRDVADKLEADDPVTLNAGGESITVDPPETPEFEVKVERETSAGATEGDLSIEFELEWDERDSGSSAADSSLSVE
jgi:amphi-Trp domain-containing protein